MCKSDSQMGQLVSSSHLQMVVLESIRRRKNIHNTSIYELLQLYSLSLDLESVFLASELCMHAAAVKPAWVKQAEQREKLRRENIS